jgi:uridine kinase
MPLLLLIGGGSASGKTTITHMIARRLNGPSVLAFSLDRYYLDRSSMSAAEIAELNFDHPESIDWARLYGDLRSLMEGKPVHLPHYDFKAHRRFEDTVPTPAADVIIIEGIFALLFDALLRPATLRLFVDTEADLRLARRIRRDIKERGFAADRVIEQYLRDVRPMHNEYVQPSRRNADLIIPGERDFSVARKILDGFVLNELIEAAMKGFEPDHR